jgi:hypothetical protein
MTGMSLAALMLAGAGAAVQPSDAEPLPLRYAQITVRERVIIRVPTRPPPPPANVRAQKRVNPPKRVKWREKNAPDCIQTSLLAAASVTAHDHIDLFLRGGARMRIKLDRSCPALDFYSGFYLKPTKDGRICADRDFVRTRSGGQCEIVAFKRLVPGR